MSIVDVGDAPAEGGGPRVQIQLLGRFRVVVDGAPIPLWTRKHPAHLVELLALQPHHRLHREQVLDVLWPDDPLDVAVPKLHKAAHFARKHTGAPGAIVLRGDVVALFPDATIHVDAEDFERAATAALEAGDQARAADVLERHDGDLLPDDPYEEWLAAPREHMRRLRIELLRLLGRWDDVLRVDPGHEESHVALMARFADAGDRYQALRQYDRLDRTLRSELGVRPGPEADAIRDRVLAAEATPQRAAPAVVGRACELAAIDVAMDGVATGRAGVVVLTGPAGSGKSALLQAAIERAAGRGWRLGAATGGAADGASAYAPVLDAVTDLCRRHPTLLDGVADAYRAEIDQALAGSDTQWDGHSTHLRLFVAVAELLRLAGATTGVVLAIDDLQGADDASIRLLHHVARALTESRVLLLLTRRPPSADEVERTGSLLGRGEVLDLTVGPLDDDAARALAAANIVGDGADRLDDIVAVAAGNPYLLLQLARHAASGPTWVASIDAAAVAGIPPDTRELLQRVATAGSAFDSDEFVALTGLADGDAFEHLDRAISLGVLEPATIGYRFRHRLVREALLRDVPPHRLRRIHRDAAERLATLGASPARIGHHLVHADDVRSAVPHLLAAAETEASLGAYRDALALVDTARPSASGTDRARLAALRADVLMALGDPAAVSAFREALELADPDDRRRLRARLARAAVMSGDVDTANAALEGMRLDGGAADGEILLAQGYAAFFSADFEGAAAVAEEARRRVLGGDQTWQVLDLVSLEGLIAHQRGEWFDRMKAELRRTRDVPAVANALFDGYLCPAEYLLYGPTPYADVIATARGLRDTALRSGALRAVAFATALIGEAAVLSGDLELAATELREAVELHHDLGAGGGEAHCLQRLAEVHLAEGDRDTARRLLDRAVPLARWSMMAKHLLQRIYGTMILAAPDPLAARAIVDRAESTLGTEDSCVFCTIMLSVPAAIVCAEVGDLEHAHHHLRAAEGSAMMWEGTAWEAATAEARAVVLAAEGDDAGAEAQLAAAVTRFEQAGHPLDVDRCRRRQRAVVPPAGG
jgi:DNA-binding SARP family transcriptional activator/tetratricopeptide (TPR) repeat protein